MVMCRCCPIDHLPPIGMFMLSSLFIACIIVTIVSVFIHTVHCNLALEVLVSKLNN